MLVIISDLFYLFRSKFYVFSCEHEYQIGCAFVFNNCCKFWLHYCNLFSRYVLKRHLLKFEAIYPNSAIPVGYIRKEPIYARECLHVVSSLYINEILRPLVKFDHIVIFLCSIQKWSKIKYNVYIHKLMLKSVRPSSVYALVTVISRRLTQILIYIATLLGNMVIFNERKRFIFF